MQVIGAELAEAVLRTCGQVRYAAVRCDGQLWLRERAQLHNASSSESDKYEELIVNPTLLTLVRQRGEIDCGGAQFVLIRYGSFFQFVAPLAHGHISIGMEPDCDPLAVLRKVLPVVRGYAPELAALVAGDGLRPRRRTAVGKVGAAKSAQRPKEGSPQTL